MRTKMTRGLGGFVVAVAAAGVIVAAVVALPGTARADLPPPDGLKYVGYTVTIENLKAFPDFVLIAYPWSTSNGAPTKEHALCEDGKPLGIGRRSAPTRLWAMRRAAYDEWKKSYQPPVDAYQDPALDALVKSDKVVACDKAPDARFQLPSGDARSAIADVMRVKLISDQSCRLEVVAARASQAGETGRSSSGSAPLTGPNKGGCAGCHVAGADRSRFGGMALALLFALMLARADRPGTRTGGRE